MSIPIIKGVIDRRILVNFRVNPGHLEKVLPSSMKPKLVGDSGIGGICLIRLRDIRPRMFPAWLGIGSENAAHRIAVEWRHDGSLSEGVYIPRRDTSSILNVFAGGRVFPGEHHLAQFQVHETQDTLRVEVRTREGESLIRVDARVANEFTQRSVFNTLGEASAFFEKGSLGYSATESPEKLEGLELRTSSWEVAPLEVRSVYSQYFQNESRFPAQSVEFDNALLMRDIEHEWHAREPLYCGVEAGL